MNKTNQTYIDGRKEAQDRRERLDNARLSGWSNAPDEPATGEGNAPRVDLGKRELIERYNSDCDKLNEWIRQGEPNHSDISTPASESQSE